MRLFLRFDQVEGAKSDDRNLVINNFFNTIIVFIETKLYMGSLRQGK